MNTYCNCANPEPDEVEKGIIVCLVCMNEIENHQDEPEPDEDDFTSAPDLVPDDSAEYEDRREEAQVMNEGGRL